MAETENELSSKKIFISRKYYLTIGVLISVLLWAIAAVYWVVDELVLENYKQEISDDKKKIEKLEQKINTYTKKLSDSENKYQTLVDKRDRPLLLKPKDRDRIISKQIELEWDFKKHDENTQYVIEIRYLGDSNKSPETYNVPHSDDQTFYYPIKVAYGEYIWRVKPGRVVNHQVTSKENWSEYNSFTVYSSVFERIKKTGIINVGMSPTFAGQFNLYNKKGGFKGFDVDLINEIGREMGARLELKKNLKIHIEEISWTELLPKLSAFEIDLVISSMTRTKKREKENNVKYTDGYFTSHQIFLAKDLDYNEALSLQENLKGKRIGVTNDTTNQAIAISFSKIFGFEVVDDFSRLAGVIQALFERRIDLALTDNTLASTELNQGRLKQFGNFLDEEIPQVKLYNLEHIGWEQEQYAIAIAQGETNLLKELNEILRSEEMEKFIDKISKEWELE